MNFSAAAYPVLKVPCRHKHHLPYALMMRNVAEQLQKVQHATVLRQEGAAGRALGKAVHSLSEDVMENWPTVSTLLQCTCAYTCCLW